MTVTPFKLHRNTEEQTVNENPSTPGIEREALVTFAAAPPAPTVASEPARPLWLERLAGLAETVVPPLVVALALLAVWEIGMSGPEAGLPTPSKVVSESWELISRPFMSGSGADQGLAWQLLASLERVFYGYSLAAIVGVLLGILLGQSLFAFRALDPLFQVLRTVPPLAWLPISLATLKQAEPSAVFVIFITAIWPIILNTAVGVRNIPQQYRNVARVLQLNGWEFFIKIMLPASVPFMFTGLRIGVGMSWLAIVAAEMLVGGTGIGFFLWDSWNSSLLSDMIVALAAIGLIGFALDRLLAALGALVQRGA